MEETISTEWAIWALRVIGELRRGLEEQKKFRVLPTHEYLSVTRETEFPPEGTVLNPQETEELKRLLREANEATQDIYAVISPLRSVGFETLNLLGKILAEIEPEKIPIVNERLPNDVWTKLGEVVDRANEFFHGR